MRRYMLCARNRIQMWKGRNCVIKPVGGICTNADHVKNVVEEIKETFPTRTG
jgi:hypothetical protein